jgi:hypothetical protein
MENTIYAFYNAHDLYNVLNAVVLITGGASSTAYLTLLRSVAIIAFLVGAGTAIAKMRGHDILLTMVGFTVFFSVFMVPKQTTYITDNITGENYSVNNVPLGISFIASTTSHIGYWLTQTYQTNFTSVNDQQMAQYGMVFGARLFDELFNSQFGSPVLLQNLAAFSSDCVKPEFLDNASLLDTMISQADIWGYIGGSGAFTLNPGRYTTYVPATGVAVTAPCTATGATFNAYTQLTSDIAATVTAQTSPLMKAILPGNQVTQVAGAIAAIPAFETALIGTSNGTVNLIRQFSMINFMRDNPGTIGTAAMGSTIGATMAVSANESSYAVMKTLAEGALPKIRNLIEELLIAISPIIFILVVAAGAQGGKVLGTYAMTFAWIQLWAPLYAVIHTIGMSTHTQQSLAIANSIGLNISNFDAMAHLCASTESLAGLMSLSVPAIALAIVKGGEMAMSGVVTSIMSTGQGEAAKIGSELGVGNISGGNVNWGNVNQGNTSMGNTAAATFRQGGASFSSKVDTASGFSSDSATGKKNVATNGDKNSINDTTSSTSDGLNKTVTGQKNLGFSRTTADGSFSMKKGADGIYRATSGVSNTSNVGGSIEAKRANEGKDGLVSSDGFSLNQGQQVGDMQERGAGYSYDQVASAQRTYQNSLQHSLGNIANYLSSNGSNTQGMSNDEVKILSQMSQSDKQTLATILGVGGSAEASEHSSAAAEGKSTLNSNTPYEGPSSRHASTGAQGGNADKPGKPGSAQLPATQNGATTPRSGTHDTNSLSKSNRLGTMLRNMLTAGAHLKNESGSGVVAQTDKFSASGKKLVSDLAAKVETRAADDVVHATNDSGVKQAAEQYKSTDSKGRKATFGDKLEAMRQESAKRETSAGQSGSAGGQMKMDLPVFQAAVAKIAQAKGYDMHTLDGAMSAGNDALAELNQNPGAVMQAIQSAENSNQPSMQSFSGTGDGPGSIPKPNTLESAKAKSKPAVAAAISDATGAVSKDAKEFAGEAKRHQHKNPNSQPDTHEADANNKFLKGKAVGAVAAGGFNQKSGAGINAIAEVLDANNNASLKTVLDNAFAGHHFTSTGAEYREFLSNAANSDHGFKNIMGDVNPSTLTPERAESLFKQAQVLNVRHPIPKKTR